jgi:putative ABC transport system permease protein
MNDISTKEMIGEKFWQIEVQSDKKDNEKVFFKLEGREKDSKLIKLYGKDGSELSFNDNIIKASLADKLGVNQGGEVIVKSDLYKANFKIKIDKVADYYTAETIYVPLEVIYKNTSIPENSYIGIVSSEDINFKDGEIASSITKSSIIEGANKMITPLKGVMLLIGVIAAIIGIAIIYVIVSMVIEENRTNISMFKIMGYEEKNLNKIIINTNDILVLIGFIMSIPLSKATLTILFAELTKSMDFTIRVVVSPKVIFIVFLIIFIIYEISKRLSRRKILRIPMEEVLNKGRE